MNKNEQEPVDGAESVSVPAGDMTETTRILEAILFASDEILSAAQLKGLLPGEPDAREVRKMIGVINADLQKQRHPFEVVELAGGFQFRTVAYYRPWVSRLMKDKTARRLSVQALECLAIIAYKQPISKAEVEAIRGVISDGAMKTLLERRMVTIVGRSDKPGRPLLYGTSKEFLEYFGINKLGDLPRIEEFEAMAREKMEKLTDEELAAIQAAPDENELTGEAMAELGGAAATQESGEKPAGAGDGGSMDVDRKAALQPESYDSSGSN